MWKKNLKNAMKPRLYQDLDQKNGETPSSMYYFAVSLLLESLDYCVEEKRRSMIVFVRIEKSKP